MNFNSILNLLNTVLSLGTFIASILIAIFVYKYTHKMWVNDVYAKKEAGHWLEYREKFYSETHFFLQFIKNTIPPRKFLFINTPCETFKEKNQSMYEHAKLHKFMKP